MRKMAALLLAVLCVAALPALAATSATQVNNQTLVTSDGVCQVYLDITLHLEQGVSDMRFPVPQNAYDISVNGMSVGSRKSGEARSLDLSGITSGAAGNLSLIVRYNLPNCVIEGEGGRLTLSLPLLSGFAYPIEALHCELRLPGPVEQKPRFISGYYQESIESDITAQVSGDTITIDAGRLKDHETLTMLLDVPAEQFPRGAASEPNRAIGAWGAAICAALAALYFLLFLRALPPRRVRQTTPPADLTAGELCCALTGEGADLTAMTLSWAQMGYLLIYLDDSGRVILHKRMEMGNERSAFEVHCFRLLFRRRSSVDATGQDYAVAAERVRALPRARMWHTKRSGNPKLLRVLAAGIGLFGATAVSMAIAGDAALAVVVHILFAALGAVGAWRIQSGAGALFLRGRRRLVVSAVCSAVWIAAGAFSGTLATAVLVVIAQWFFGAAAAFGGRRTPEGRQIMAQVLGLRHYLRTVPSEELHARLRRDPNCFFALAPYAVALGVGKRFAGKLGAARLPSCPYLTTGMDAHMNAAEWNRRITDTADAMDELRAALRYSRFFSAGAAAPTQKRRRTAQTRTRR